MSLILNSISIFQFKNYFDRQFKFTGRIVGICGSNGVGKTNLLDAIYYLCFTRSYFSRQDQLNTQHGHEGFRLEGEFKFSGKEEKAVCILRENGRKEFYLNDNPYTKFSRHIGRYPCVIIAPDDVQMIIGASEERRKFIDTLLSQLQPDYLQSLICYSKLLQQRNSFLRTYTESYDNDLSVLDILDDQLAKAGDAIFIWRKEFLLKFLPMVKVLYNDIGRQYEDISLIYESELMAMDMLQLLKMNRQKDLMLQRSSAGTHKDDILVSLGKHSFKSVASQGQRKSLLFALKLSEMEMLKQEKQLSPILLLDDVFEKLDEERISNLLLKVCSDVNSQIFITDTNCSRLREQFDKMGIRIQMVLL